MEDLIRRSDAIEVICEIVPIREDAIEIADAIRAIPSADTDISEYSDKLWKNAYERGKADRPQGEWVPISEVTSNLGHKCSNCGEKAEKIVTRSVLVDNYYCNKAEPITEYTHKEQLSKFCPNCGARMKGADDED